MTNMYKKQTMYLMFIAAVMANSLACAADNQSLKDARTLAAAMRSCNITSADIIERLADRIAHLTPIVTGMRQQAEQAESLISQLEQARAMHHDLMFRKTAILRALGVTDQGISVSIANDVPMQQVSSSSSSSSSAVVSAPAGRKNELKWLLTPGADFSGDRLRPKRAMPLIDSNADSSSLGDEYSSDGTISTNSRTKRARSTRSAGAINSRESDEAEESFYCEACDKDFDTLRGLRAHLARSKEHAAFRAQIEGSSALEDEQKSNSNEDNADDLIGQEQTPPLASELLCSPCNRYFGTPRALRIHEGKSQHQKVVAEIPSLSSPLDNEQELD